MQKRSWRLSLLALAVIALHASEASAQSFPNKPIRIVTAQVGGGQDFGSRLIGPYLSQSLGQQVIVENRSGGTIGGEIVSKASPDGHTLIYSGTIFWIVPLMRKISYDVLRDFAPVTLATRSPNVLIVHPALPAKSVKELIALAKAKPGELNYGTGGAGSSNHLAAELFKSMAGVNITTVQYKGSGPAVIGVLGGEVQMMFPSAGSGLAGHLKAGRLRALAVTSAEATALVPGVPSIAAAGVPGYESTQKAGIFVPAKTPAAIIDRLNREIVAVLNRPDVKEKFVADGVDIVGSRPEELAAVVKSEIARLGKLIKDAGISTE